MWSHSVCESEKLVLTLWDKFIFYNIFVTLSCLFFLSLYCNTLTGSMAVSHTATQPRKLTVMWSKVSSVSIDT